MEGSTTIRARLRKHFLLVGLLPALVLTIALLGVAYYLLSQQALKQNEAALELAANSIQARLEVLSDLFSHLPRTGGTSSELSADSLYSLLTDEAGELLLFQASNLPAFRRIRSAISNTYLRNNRYINGIYLITTSDHLFNFSDSYDPQLSDMGNYSRWRSLMPDDGEMALIPSGMSGAYRQSYAAVNETSALTLVRQIDHIVTRKPLALAIVDINESFFEPLNILQDRSQIVMRSSDGAVWYMIGEDVPTALGGARITRRIPLFGGVDIELVTASPLTLNMVSNIMLICIGVALLTFAYAVSSSIRNAKRLSAPITNLAREMEGMSGSLPMPISEIGDTREIRQLYTQYNRMLDAINQHIRDKYENELALSRMQMKAMEAQVDAHFLYNTLECVYSMALVNGTQDIARVVKSLSDMFRYISKTSAATVPVKNELQHVQDYFTIQRARYGDSVQLEVAVQDDILDIPILKLCLQPLVENAFKHGFTEVLGEKRIRVVGSRKNGMIRLMVWDNGIGMDDRQLAALVKSLESENESDVVGVGLSNIVSRLRLQYRDKASILIHSERGKGTTIYLNIPEEEAP